MGETLHEPNQQLHHEDAQVEDLGFGESHLQIHDVQVSLLMKIIFLDI